MQKNVRNKRKRPYKRERLARAKRIQGRDKRCMIKIYLQNCLKAK
ncbi:hypothetical protein [Campylobacter fetus]|nr:hypothetical protein [Campylobacter fetus]